MWAEADVASLAAALMVQRPPARPCEDALLQAERLHYRLRTKYLEEDLTCEAARNGILACTQGVGLPRAWSSCSSRSSTGGAGASAQPRAARLCEAAWWKAAGPSEQPQGRGHPPMQWAFPEAMPARTEGRRGSHLSSCGRFFFSSSMWDRSRIGRAFLSLCAINAFACEDFCSLPQAEQPAPAPSAAALDLAHCVRSSAPASR